MSDLAEIVRRHFKAKVRICVAWKAAHWTTWTATHHYNFHLFPPPRSGSPDTDHLYLLRVEYRSKGEGTHTAFSYHADVNELVRQCASSMKDLRKKHKLAVPQPQ